MNRLVKEQKARLAEQLKGKEITKAEHDKRRAYLEDLRVPLKKGKLPVVKAKPEWSDWAESIAKDLADIRSKHPRGTPERRLMVNACARVHSDLLGKEGIGPDERIERHAFIQALKMRG